MKIISSNKLVMVYLSLVKLTRSLLHRKTPKLRIVRETLLVPYPFVSVFVRPNLVRPNIPVFENRHRTSPLHTHVLSRVQHEHPNRTSLVSAIQNPSSVNRLNLIDLKMLS